MHKYMCMYERKCFIKNNFPKYYKQTIYLNQSGNKYIWVIEEL